MILFAYISIIESERIVIVFSSNNENLITQRLGFAQMM